MEIPAIFYTLGCRGTASPGAFIGAQEARVIPTSCQLRAAVFLRADVARCTTVFVRQV